VNRRGYPLRYWAAQARDGLHAIGLAEDARHIDELSRGNCRLGPLGDQVQASLRLARAAEAVLTALQVKPRHIRNAQDAREALEAMAEMLRETDEAHAEPAMGGY